MEGQLSTLLGKSTIQKRQSCQKYLFSQTDQLFFWGHPLTKIYRGDIFIKLPRYTESPAFCFISAALTMFALKNNPTARLVQADIYEEGNIYRHGWVEFFYHRAWWVADFAWTEASENPRFRSNFNHWETPCNKWVCSYHKFWSHPTTKALEHFLLTPETSHIFCELYTYAGCQRKGGIEFLGPKGSALVKDPNHGKVLPEGSPIYLIPDGNPLHPVCRTAVNDLLTNDYVTESNLAKIEQTMQGA